MIIGKGGIESGSKVFGAGGADNGTRIFGEGGELSGSYVFNKDILTATNIATLSGTQYGTIDTAVTFGVDFEVEIEFATANTGTTIVFYGSAGVITDFFTFVSDDTVRVKVNNITLDSAIGAALPYRDGKIHAAVVRRTGSTVTVDIDGVQMLTGTAAGNHSIGEIASYNTGSLPFIGQILSTKFTDQLGAVRNFVFDSGSEYYQLPRGESLGAELSGDPSCDNAGYWDVINGATFDGDGVDINFSGAFSEIIKRSTSGHPLTIGDTVLCEVIVSSFTSGRIVPYAGNTVLGSLTAAGTFYLIGEVTTNGVIQLATEGFVGTVSKLSFKKLPDNALILQNFALADWSRYTLQRNIVHDAGTVALGWVGENVVVNGRFDADTDWTKGDGWSISGGLASCDGSQLAVSALYQTVGLQNAPHLYSFTISNRLAGSLLPRVLSGDGTIRSSDGTYTEIITAGSGVITGVRADIDFIGSIDNVSAQHLLEVV